MTLIRWLPFLLCLSLSALADDYFPPRGDWSHIDPAAAGFDPARLEDALALARELAVVEPSDMAQVIRDAYTDREPDYRILGPTAPREGPAAIIVRGGRIVAEFGDVHRVDMTFSVVKSYLSTVAALAQQAGLIDDLQRPVREWVRDGSFDSEHNAPITWHHLLNQTSDWQGTLWEVADWADRPEGDDPDAWPRRELHPPGSHFKYNDVRVNLLAYALLQVWRKPLPVVLREAIMDPIGASTTWRWHGYDNSWVTLDGQRLQSVSGGGHFGGGMFISARDHARFGLLFLRGGNWAGRSLVPSSWIETMRQPTPARPDYGYLWWLNTDRQAIPAAPESAYWAAGFGGNYIYIDEAHDLVIVLRWIPDLPAVVTAVLSALVVDQG